MKQIIFQGIEPQDFINQIDTIITSRIKEQLEKQNKSKFELAEYRNGVSVCKFLGISYPTLHAYVKRGLITRFEINNCPKYKTKEITELLIKIEQKRA